MWIGLFFRFDESGASPLTVKALTEAGYVQMTAVQEATLSAFLEGITSTYHFDIIRGIK